jgi:hypothetical protein
VVVTSIVSVADRVPSLTVKRQWPTATGVALNVPLPLAGETVAIPLHEFVVPLAAVLTVNVPLKPASVAVKVCAAPAPVVMNERADGARAIAEEPGVGDGVGDGVGEAVAVGEAVGVTEGRGVGDGVGEAVVVGEGVTDGPGVGDGVGEVVTAGDGVGVATATVEAVPPAPLHAGTEIPSARAAANSQSRDVTNRPREKRWCGAATSVRHMTILALPRAPAYPGNPLVLRDGSGARPRDVDRELSARPQAQLGEGGGKMATRRRRGRGQKLRLTG